MALVEILLDLGAATLFGELAHHDGDRGRVDKAVFLEEDRSLRNHRGRQAGDMHFGMRPQAHQHRAKIRQSGSARLRGVGHRSVQN
jgi:hypothetical protein